MKSLVSLASIKVIPLLYKMYAWSSLMAFGSVNAANSTFFLFSDSFSFFWMVFESSLFSTILPSTLLGLLFSGGFWEFGFTVSVIVDVESLLISLNSESEAQFSSSFSLISGIPAGLK